VITNRSFTTGPEIARDPRRRLTESLARKARGLGAGNHRLTALSQLGRWPALGRDPQRLLDRYGRAGRQVIGARWALLAMLAEDGKAFRHVRCEDLGPAPIGFAFTLAGDSPAERVAPAYLRAYGWEEQTPISPLQ